MGKHTHHTPAPDLPPPVSDATRRDLLGTFASMLLLVPSEAGAGKAAEIDGELLAACREFVRFDTAYAATCLAEDRMPDGPEKDTLRGQLETFDDQQHSVYVAICNTPARTPEGLRAKAGLVLSYLREDGMGVDVDIALSLARDVAGRA